MIHRVLGVDILPFLLYWMGYLSDILKTEVCTFHVYITDRVFMSQLQ